MYNGFENENFKDLKIVNNVLSRFKSSLNTALRRIGLSELEIKVDAVVFLEVLIKTQEDINRVNNQMGSNANVFKKFGYFCYWIKRLKPFSLNTEHKVKHYANEFIAISYARFMISQTSCKNSNLKVSQNFYSELFYLMRFENISKDGMSTILMALYSECHKKIHDVK